MAMAMGQVMRGEAAPSQIGALLVGMGVQGETADEVTGTVRALRAAMVRVRVDDRRHLVDTCGTGGGAVTTFNISTAAAFVAVGAGARVAKHGNRSYSSKCGSADVLEALGIAIEVDADTAASLIERAGMAFLFAPTFHPAMRHVAPIRKELGITTIMNIVGPAANPAGVTRQVIGVADPKRAPVLAEVLARLGAEHALVVHGVAGLDEISPAGVTQYWEVRGSTIEEGELDPKRYGLAHQDLDALAGGVPAENAERIKRLLEEPGRDPAGRSAVTLNAGAAVYVAGLAPSLGDGMEAAAASLEEGRGLHAVERLRSENPV